MTRTSVLPKRHRRRVTTVLMWAVIAVWSVVAIAGLAACSSDGSDGAATPSSSSASLSSPVTTSASAASTVPTTDTPVTTTAPIVTPTGAGQPGVDHSRCTNRTNYAGDPRSNAEINSIGERTGICPPVLTAPSTR